MDDSVPHIVGDHQRGQLLLTNDAFRHFQYLGRRFGIQSGGVLVQQQQLRLLQRCHQQGQRLTLTAGKQPHLGGHAVFQPQIQALEQLLVFFPLGGGNAGPQTASLAAPLGQRQIFLDLHGRGRAHHGVLKDPANVAGPLVFRQIGHIHPVDRDAALIYRPDARHGVEQRGFARAVAADDRDEIAVVQGQGNAVQRGLFVDRARIKGLADLFDLKHGSFPLSRAFW